MKRSRQKIIRRTPVSFQYRIYFRWRSSEIDHFHPFQPFHKKHTVIFWKCHIPLFSLSLSSLGLISNTSLRKKVQLSKGKTKYLISSICSLTKKKVTKEWTSFHSMVVRLLSPHKIRWQLKRPLSTFAWQQQRWMEHLFLRSILWSLLRVLYFSLRPTS